MFLGDFWTSLKMMHITANMDGELSIVSAATNTVTYTYK